MDVSGVVPLSRPDLRSRSHAHDLPSIERELGRIWSGLRLTTTVDGVEERRVVARTSVMNLVVMAARPETGERCADVIGHLTGRHPSRTLVVLPSDPDGPSWIDADIQAHCMLPRAGSAEACSERIFLKAGGEAGRHPAAVVAPLLIHDLPVTLWWPGGVPFGTDGLHRLLALADRLVVDGSSWPEDGLDALRAMAALLGRSDVPVSDFALIRQSRWREAIASTFDVPDLRPFVRSLRRIVVAYAAGPAGATGPVNVVKPLYHVAWLASRLGLAVDEPLRPIGGGDGAATGAAAPGEGRGPIPPARGLSGVLRRGRRRTDVELRPEASEQVRGTTLRVELEAVRRGSVLEVVVTAGATAVTVTASRNGEHLRHRSFLAHRRTEVDMLTEVIESVGHNPLTVEAMRTAAALVSPRARPRAVEE